MKVFSRILLAFLGFGFLACSANAQYISNPNPNLDNELGTFVSTTQEQDQDDGNDITIDEDKKMLFNCTNWEWERVIEVFTERTGLALQPIDEYPPGSVTIYENEPYTVMEGLDKLNMNLAIKGYTLVRKGNQLFLTEIRDLTPQMVENVDPEDLKNRGKYEIMRTSFDLSELDAEELERSITARITDRGHRAELLYIPSIKRISVRETGEVLREIKLWVDLAREEAAKKAPGRRKYMLKNFPPEQILTLARPLIGLDEGQNSMEFEDGTKLTLVYDILDDYILVNSSNEKIDETFKIFEELDVAAPEVNVGSVAQKTLEKHAVSGDQDLAMQIMQSFFEGRDVMLDQDAQTGDIMLFGTKKDHEDADSYLAIANGDTSRGLKSIPLKYRTQAEMVTMLLPLLGITENADGTITGNGPKIVPVTDTDALFVMGTPQEVIKVSQMIEQLDLPSSSATSGVPTNARFLPMSMGEAMRLTDDLPEIFPITGRKNKLLIVKPEDRKIPRRSLLTDEELDDIQQQFEDSLQTNPKRQGPNPDDQSYNDAIDLARYRFVSTGQQEDDDQVGETSDEGKTNQEDYYQLPETPESVPGAPITVKIVDGGIVLESDDLSALDDMVDLLNQLMSETSEEDMPAVFYLKHRRPDVVKALLDQYIGLSSGSTGGGGGGGNLIQNVASNALGPAADLFGGLFGGGLGGGAGTGGGYALEGDVSTYADVKLNYILVKGHTLNDYDVIAMHIDLLDQPETPVDLDLVGEMRRIPIFHREPQEIYDFVVAALPEYIESADGGGGGNGGGGNEQQMMQQMMRALGGGGNGGGQSIDTEAEKPKATVSVDSVRPALVVTGPEFIFRKIEAMVLVNDTKEPIANQKSQLIDLSGVDPALAAQFLETVYPGKLTVIQGEAGEGGNAGSGNGGNNGQNQANQARAQQQAAMQQMMRAAMQQRGRQQGGGGRAGGGGGRGGGGGGRGGGGGGRGGR